LHETIHIFRASVGKFCGEKSGKKISRRLDKNEGVETDSYSMILIQRKELQA
jgi:hypothetical protein